MHNIYHDKSVFILGRDFEHIVKLRRRPEAGKDLIKRTLYPAIMPCSYTDALSVISQFRKNWEKVIVNLKNLFPLLADSLLSFLTFSLPSDNQYSRHFRNIV